MLGRKEACIGFSVREGIAGRASECRGETRLTGTESGLVSVVLAAVRVAAPGSFRTRNTIFAPARPLGEADFGTCARRIGSIARLSAADKVGRGSSRNW